MQLRYRESLHTRINHKLGFLVLSGTQAGIAGYTNWKVYYIEPNHTTSRALQQSDSLIFCSTILLASLTMAL